MGWLGLTLPASILNNFKALWHLSQGVYVIVTPWAQVLSQIYKHLPEGHRPWVSVYISGKAFMPMI